MTNWLIYTSFLNCVTIHFEKVKRGVWEKISLFISLVLSSLAAWLNLFEHRYLRGTVFSLSFYWIWQDNLRQQEGSKSHEICVVNFSPTKKSLQSPDHSGNILRNQKKKKPICATL
ncbi:hypothetical protein SAMN05216244_2512 [Sediminibacillus halophilus]|uniref:Uncharacterized protein n=1 Tax=Sediminibacillus halophilus TaxID=482461 RepID=A0A1G9TAY6_9BACI|nr:hypothetical protein SAMN05216244_2512 [Sediminibacillus halophilus]